jgi:putative membrane protein
MKVNGLSRFNFGLDDLRRMWEKKPMRLALVGILLVPLVYSFIYLSAFYDPYANLSRLPVAVVNEDQGAVKDGEPVNIGKDLTKELRKESKVKWEFVSRTQMFRGFDHGDFCIGIVIPKDFSAKAVSVDSSKPLKGELEYYIDESNNYLSGKIGDSLKKELEKSLDEKLTRVYVAAIFDSIAKSAQELEKAADGAKMLADKTGEAADGSKQVQNGLIQLQSAAGQLQAGQNQMLAGLRELQQKTVEDKRKVDQLPWDRINQAQSLVHQINDAIHQMANAPVPEPGVAVSQLHQQAVAGTASVFRADREIEDFWNYLEDVQSRHPKLAKDPAFTELKSKVAKAEQYQEGAKQDLGAIQSELPNLENDWHKWLALRKQIAAQSQQMTQKVDQQIVVIQKMRRDVDQLVVGANALVNGAEKIAAGQSRMADGIVKMKNGSSQLTDGLEKIKNGQKQLSDGLSEGVQKAKDNLRGVGQKEKVISHPVDVRDHSRHPVPNYATGFAPYFISLSLWVGAMLLFTIIDLYRVFDDKGEPLSLSAGGLIGAGQAVILSSVLTFALNIKPELPGWLYLFTIVMSFVFIAINQMLVALLGNVGRFLSIVVLMLQLASSGGTYPVELLPHFFQTLHPYLPMTYTIQGLRAILSNGNVQTVIRDLDILLEFLVISFVITQIYQHFGKKWLRKLTLKIA